MRTTKGETEKETLLDQQPLAAGDVGKRVPHFANGPSYSTRSDARSYAVFPTAMNCQQYGLQLRGLLVSGGS